MADDKHKQAPISSSFWGKSRLLAGLAVLAAGLGVAFILYYNGALAGFDQAQAPASAPEPENFGAGPAATNTPSSTPVLATGTAPPAVMPPSPTPTGPGPAPVLELVEEHKIRELFPQAIFEKDNQEASGVLFKEDYFYVIFDNLSQIARIRKELPPNSPENILLGGRDEADSTLEAPRYEDIAYDERNHTFYLLNEAFPSGQDDSYRASLEEYSADFNYLKNRWLPFWFEDENKGFEGLALQHRQGIDYLLALCEGNKCEGGRKGRKPGEGRIQVFQKTADGWAFMLTMKLPEAVRFEDYSALAIQGNRVAIASQESAQLWVGTLQDSGWGFVDSDEAEMIRQTIYQFPNNEQGAYCNIEGVAWVSPDQIVAVSDKANQDQPEECRAKDQSIHIFNIPKPE